MRRRTFLQQLSALAVLPQAPAIVTSDRARPVIDAGVAAGPLGARDAIIWAHVDRPGRMVVEYSTTPSFIKPVRIANGLNATPGNGLTGRTRISNLPAGQDIFYRVRFEDDSNSKVLSAPVEGRFRTAPQERRRVRIAWSGDVVGQGWGIDTARGGMQLFRTMANENPDLFLHVGDTIYADAPLAETVTLDDGTLWKNVMTPSKAKVAETLDEFRGNHLYNRLDEHYRRFSSEVAQVVMWDDHEVRNNWFHSEILDDPRYTERRVSVLASRARQAFLEQYPVTMERSADAAIYRSIPMGPLVDVFALDMRSYRSANNANMQPVRGADTNFLGDRQLRWLADGLTASKATWKVVAADMPIGLVVSHTPGLHEAAANGDPGPARGRELEIAWLLKTLQERRVKNVIWVTADVHYSAAHHFHPDRAATKQFDPFWEFVAGPAHAGTFSMGEPDLTFGTEVRFKGVPPDLKPNRPPDAGLQFFGVAEINPADASMTVSIVNTAGTRLFEQRLEPSR
ncbi:MAG TPA: alkaline phosphatase D family protein [Vicinamibacterales bacterium]|nr:alkaline phosphatase D family protein [Vicinamibacterales bacterium]